MNKMRLSIGSTNDKRICRWDDNDNEQEKKTKTSSTNKPQQQERDGDTSEGGSMRVNEEEEPVIGSTHAVAGTTTQKAWAWKLARVNGFGWLHQDNTASR